MTAFQEECSRDLAAAEPVIREAEAALNSLDKASLGELKSFGSPAAEVVQVLSACMVLTAPGGKIPKVLRPIFAPAGSQEERPARNMLTSARSSSRRQKSRRSLQL